MSLLIADAKTRADVEAYTNANTFPNVIKFIEDKAGNWCTSNEVLADPAYIKYFQSDLKDIPTKGVIIAPNPKDATPVGGDTKENTAQISK